MGDTHESAKNLSDVLLRLQEDESKKQQFQGEQGFRQKQLAQQAMELDETRKARAAQMAEMINARKQGTFERMLPQIMNEEMKKNPKEDYQTAVHNVMQQFRPEYRNMSPFGYDQNYKPAGAAGANGASGADGHGGQSMDIGKSLGLPELQVGLSPEQNLDTSLTPYAVARAKALQMKMKVAPDNGETTPAAQYVPGSGSDLGF